jgi:hypothetical protein
MISWVNPSQVEVVFHALTKGGKGLGIKLGHQKQRYTRIKMISIDDHATTAPAWALAFLCHCDFITVACKESGGGNPSYAGANYENLWPSSVKLHR